MTLFGKRKYLTRLEWNEQKPLFLAKSRESKTVSIFIVLDQITSDSESRPKVLIDIRLETGLQTVRNNYFIKNGCPCQTVVKLMLREKVEFPRE